MKNNFGKPQLVSKRIYRNQKDFYFFRLGVCFGITIFLATLFLIRYTYNEPYPKKYSIEMTPFIDGSMILEPTSIKQKVLVENVLFVDEQSIKASRESIEGSRVTLEWSKSALKAGIKASALETIDVEPFLASIDRRPSTVWTQMLRDPNHAGGKMLGCAFSTNTMVSPINYFKKWESKSCSVCFQFSNLAYANNFLRHHEITMDVEGSIVCIQGKKSLLKTRFLYSQLDAHDDQKGYPFTLDCILPNGISQLTCRHISETYNNRHYNDDLQNIYIQTVFSITLKEQDNKFFVYSRWSWGSIQTSNDDRSEIAKQMPEHGTDTKSFFIPSTYQEMKFSVIQGPMLSQKNNSTESFITLFTSLIHQILYSPNSNRLIGIPHGKFQSSAKYIQGMISTPIHEILKQDQYLLSSLQPLLSQCNSTMTPTLRHLLEQQHIQIHLFSIPILPLSIKLMKMGGQYGFVSYIAARYAADYQAIMYMDEDSILIKDSKEIKTLQEVLFDRMFSSDKAHLCSDQRLLTIEVQPSALKPENVYECTLKLVEDRSMWKRMMSQCSQSGLVIARCDTVISFDLHHVEMERFSIPEGVNRCEQDFEDTMFQIPSSQFVQMHVSHRQKPNACRC